MKTDKFKDVTLPKNFHYHGMNKIKAGKGYRDGKALGVKEGKCKYCHGTIIRLRMNISNKGFECTSELVCDKCGTVYNMPYMILGKQDVEPLDCGEDKINITTYWETDDALTKYYNDKGEQLYTKHFKCNDKKGQEKQTIGEIKRPRYKKTYAYHWVSHKSWLENNCCPTYEPTSSTETYEEGEEPAVIVDMQTWIKDQIKIGKAIGLCTPKHSMLYNRSKEEKAEYDRAMRMQLLEAIASNMELNPLQAAQAKYAIDEDPGLMKYPYPIEDIMLCICLYVMSLCVDNGRMATIKRQYPMWKDRYSTLYSVIRDKLDNMTL
jgi:hypothetical protein